MVGVGVRLRTSTIVVCCLSGLVLLGLSVSTCGALATLERLEFEIISEFPGSLPADSAVVGDTVRIAAVLTPNGEEAEEVLATFYYENKITKETAQIGATNVPWSHVAAGSFRRAVVEWNLGNIQPGIYNVFVVGNFEAASSENATLKSLKVLKEGRAVGFLLDDAGRLVQASGSLTGELVIPLCAMGEAVARVNQDIFDDQLDGRVYRGAKTVTVELTNLGTDTIAVEDFEEGENGEPQLRCSYRIGGEDETAFQELKNACWILNTRSTDPEARTKLADPGEDFTLKLYFQYTFGFENADLGEPKAVQLRLQAYDSDESPLSDPVYVPEKAGETNAYSWVDLWTSPDRVSCCTDCEEEAEGKISLAPVIASWPCQADEDACGFPIVAFHAVESGGASSLHSSEIALSGASSAFQYIKTASARWEEPWKPASGGTIEAIAAIGDPSGVVRVYVATGEGEAYGILDTVYGPSSIFRGQDYSESWGPVTLSGTVLNPPLVVEDQTMVVFVTSDGLFAVDSQNGDKLWEMKDPDKTPILAAAEADGNVWFASAEDVYHLEARRDSVSPDAVVRASLTSPIVAKAFSDGSVGAAFAEANFVLFHDPTESGELPEMKACTRCEVVSLGLAGGSAGSAIIYAASEDGVNKGVVVAGNPVIGVDSLQGCDPPDFEGVPTNIAVLSDPNDLGEGDAVPRAVFVTTDAGELRSFTQDLCEPVQVVLWPSYDTAGAPEPALSKYELLQVTLNDPDLYDPAPAVLTAPIIATLDAVDATSGYPLIEVLLFGASDGRLYVFDLTRAGKEDSYWKWQGDS